MTSRKWLCALLIFAAGFLCFGRTIGFEFLNWDDVDYIVQNPRIRALDLRRTFTEPDTAFLPLRTLSFALDYQLWGLQPWGYHLHNVLLYALSGVLAWLLLRYLIEDETAALIGALVFALHPVHTESVAWCSGRKDVLSLCFFLGAFLSYLRYTREGRFAPYILSIVLFVAAMLSKATTVVLPVLLVLYDIFWRRDRRRTIILDKVPFVALAGAITILGVIVGVGEEAIKPLRQVVPTTLTMFAVFADYLREIFIPLNLAPRYEVREITAFGAALPWILIVLFYFVLTFALIRRVKEWSFAMLWFVAALLPVMNIVPISTLKADRYLLIPSVMVSIVIAAAAARWRRILPLTAIVPILFGLLSFQQSGQWATSRTLWEAALSRAPRDPIAHYNLAHYLYERGEIRRAIGHWVEAGDVLLAKAAERQARAGSFEARGDSRRAAAERLTALEIERAASECFANAGTAYYALRDYRNALRNHEAAYRLQPSSYSCNLALLYDYFKMGRMDEARGVLKRLRQLKRDDAGEAQFRRIAGEAEDLEALAQRLREP